MIAFALPAFVLICFLVFAARRRLFTYLHLFQQEEYDNSRFLHWLWESRAFDTRLSRGLFVLVAGQLIPTVITPVLPAFAAIAFLLVAAFERNPLETAKKPLAMTARAKRIYGIALALCAALGIAAALASEFVLVWIVAVQLIPLTLVVANLALAPFEALVQRRYWREARAVLERVQPIVIAVTGSYGKTSVKHILGHVLETAGPTLITPGSVNTAMGIARVIRERLGAHHRYFVVEMGAYGIGSIRHLCALTPPRIGIISAIGKAHYERFKSLDAVAHAKFELAEAVRDKLRIAHVGGPQIERPRLPQGLAGRCQPGDGDGIHGMPALGDPRVGCRGEQGSAVAGDEQRARGRRARTHPGSGHGARRAA